MSTRSASLYLLPLLLSFPLLTLPLSDQTLLLLAFPLLGSHPDNPSPTAKQLFILPTTYGGTGNQIYFLLQAIYLAHSTNSTLLLPPPPTRNLPNRSTITLSHHIDVPRLSALIPIAESLPPQCRNSFAHVVHAYRAATPPTTFSPRMLSLACHFTNPILNASRTSCGEAALRHTQVHNLRLPLSRTPDPCLHRLLTSISGCLLLDGHSYNHAGDTAQEALHSYLHYLQPSPRIRALANEREADVVLHLRYDEHECFRKRRHRDGFVCVRTRLSTAEGVVQWVDPVSFVAKVVQEARSRRLRSLYIAFSPYVPQAMVTRLDTLLKKDLIVLPRVRYQDHDMENLVERQIAVNAKLFVGDFGSTWSGTVYYKRRTLDRGTVWTCRLLDICEGLGYYRFEGALRKPEWFQNAGFL